MAAITTRSTAGTGATVKNSPLTNTELDSNFINLNTDLSNAVYLSGTQTVGGNKTFSGITTIGELRSTTSYTQNFSYSYSFTSYLMTGETQKIFQIIPAGSSENYSIYGKIYIQSADNTQAIDIECHLRSNALPALAWETYYTENLNGIITPYVKPVLWTKQISPAGFIFGIEGLVNNIQMATAVLTVVNRGAGYPNNVTFINSPEVSVIDTDYTSNNFTLRQRTISAVRTEIPLSTASTTTATGALVVSGGVGIGGSLNIGGNLTINGTTTTVNSTTVTIDDPIFTLGGDTAPTIDDNKDRGIEFRYHNGTVAKTGFFGFDDSTGYFTFIPDATNSSEVFTGTPGDIQATNFRGDLIGNASTVTNGVYTTGTYNNPSWITSLSETKVLPTQTGNSGKYLTTDGTSTSWATVTLPSGQTSGSATSGYLQYAGTTKTAGQFDGGTTAPTSTTRLNYDGYLYATSFYGNLIGNADTVTNGFYTTSSFNLGTTSIDVNRASASQNLTGISIDGSAGSLSTNTSYMVSRGTIADDSIDSATSNGFYLRSYTGASASTLVWDASGSTGTVQLDVMYGNTGSIRLRNKTDNTTWSSWRTFLTDQNYTSYALPLSGGTVTGRVTLTSSAEGDNYAGVIRISPTAGSAQWGGISFPDTNGGTSNSNNYWFYGRGGAIADRTMTAHIPSYSDYGSTGTVPSWGVYTTGASPLFRVYADGLVTATTFTGALSGNATTATTATNATNISNSGTVTLATATESNSITITQPSYTTDQPVKLLNFDWYGNTFSIGNIRSGSTGSNGLGFFYTASGGSRTELGRFDTSGKFYLGANGQGVNASSTLRINGDITAARGNGTSGVIYLGNSGNSYVYYDGSNYFMPTGQLDVNGSRVLNAGNYSNYATPRSEYKSFGTIQVSPNGSNATCTTAQFIADLNSKGMFGYPYSTAKCSWDYAGNNNISDTGYGEFELAGSVIQTWNDGSYKHIRITRPTTGSANFQELVYNDQGSGYSPGWRSILTNENGLQLSGGTMTGSLSIRNTSPTIYLQDTDHNVSMIHCNSNIFYILRGATDSTTWTQVGGYWPLQIDLTNNNAQFGAAITAIGNVTAYSDERLKKDWKNLPENFIDKLSQVKHGTYNRTDLDVRQVGVSAQSLQTVLPEAVVLHEGTDKLSVSYGNAALASCVELAKEIKKLQSRIQQLEALL